MQEERAAVALNIFINKTEDATGESLGGLQVYVKNGMNISQFGLKPVSS